MQVVPDRSRLSFLDHRAVVSRCWPLPGCIKKKKKKHCFALIGMLIWRLRREERTERHFDSFGFWWNVLRRVEWWNINGAKGKHVQYVEEGVNNWRRSFDELSPPTPNLRSNRTAMGPSPPQRSGQFDSVGRNWEGVMSWDVFPFFLSFFFTLRQRFHLSGECRCRWVGRW